MVPMRDFATTEQAAAFYETEVSTVRSVVNYHKDEFTQSGYRAVRGAELRELKASPDFGLAFKCASQVGVFDRRAILLLGMLLRDSEVAKSVRRPHGDLPIPLLLIGW